MFNINKEWCPMSVVIHGEYHDKRRPYHTFQYQQGLASNEW